MEKRYQPNDSHLVNDMILFAENDYKLCEWLLAYHQNAFRKIKRGIFDHDKAIKLFEYYAKNIKDAYCKNCNVAISKNDILCVAEYFLFDFYREQKSTENYRNGSCPSIELFKTLGV